MICILLMYFYEGTTLIDGALINSAIQLFVKYFTNLSGKGRSQLYEKVFGKYAQSIGKKYLTQFNRFYNTRRRSRAHDDNDFKENMVVLQ